MPTLAAVIVPVRADVTGLPSEVKNGLSSAFRQSEPAVREGAAKHGTLFGRLFGSGASGSLTRGLSGAVSGVGAQFAGMAGVATGALGVTTAGIGALVGAAAVMGTKTAASMEQAQIGFETLLGSGKAAQTFLTNLQQFAAATPFELPGLIDSSRLLLGVGVSAKDTMGILQSFGNASSAVGVGQENFQRIMLATSQAIGAGRFMTQDLNQITENGIPIWTILSRAMGKPVPVLRTLASQGKLLSSDVLPVLEKQMNKDYGGAMIKQSRSLNGVWSTFMDTLNIGLANVIRPLIPAMNVGLTGATTVLTAVLSAIPRVFSGAGASGTWFATVVQNLTGWIRNDLVPAFQAVYARVLPAVQNAIRQVGRAFADHQDAVKAIGQVFQGLGFVITRILLPALGFIATTLIGEVAPAIRILLTTVGVISTVVTAVATGVPRIAGAISGGFTGAYRAVTGFTTGTISTISGWVTGAYRAASGFGQAINNAVLGGLRAAGTWLVGVGSAIIGGLIAGWNTVAPHLAIAAGHTRDGIMIAFRAAGSWLTGAGRAILQGLITGYNAMIAPWLNVVAGFVTQRILAPVARAAMWWVNAGRNTVTGFMTGVAAIGRTVGAWVTSHVITPATNMFRAALTWLVQRGQQTVTGFLNGVATVGRTVGGWLTSRVITPATNVFRAAASWLVARGQQAVSGFLGGVATVGRTVGTWVQTRVINPVTSRFTGAVGWLRAAGSNIVSGLLGGITSALSGIRNWVRDHIVNPVINAVKWFFGIHSPSTVMSGIGGNLIAGLLQGLVKSNPTALIGKIFGGMPSALGAIVNKGIVGLASLPGKAMSALGSVASKVGGLVSGLFSGGGSGGSTTFGSGVSRYSTVVLQALQMLGQPASWLGTVLSRMQRESGGNPTVVNKWDSNWAAGTPSVGLMQVIGPTFAANAGPLRGRGPFEYGVSVDPLANVYAGLRYALGRYGSLGALSRPGGYDAGGWLPPGGLGMNLTGRPERVLDPQQSQAYSAGGGAGNVRVLVMLDGAILDDRVHVIVEDAVGELGARIDNGIGG